MVWISVCSPSSLYFNIIINIVFSSSIIKGGHQSRSTVKISRAKDFNSRQCGLSKQFFRTNEFILKVDSGNFNITAFQRCSESKMIRLVLKIHRLPGESISKCMEEFASKSMFDAAKSSTLGEFGLEQIARIIKTYLFVHIMASGDKPMEIFLRYVLYWWQLCLVCKPASIYTNHFHGVE